MPRGLIHQAETDTDDTDTDGQDGFGGSTSGHSLHATVSTYHRTAWADLLVREGGGGGECSGYPLVVCLTVSPRERRAGSALCVVWCCVLCVSGQGGSADWPLLSRHGWCAMWRAPHAGACDSEGD